MAKLSEQEEKKHLLYVLGDEIRKRGVEVPKKHGSFWVLKLQSGILFYHDDYNYRVRAVYPDDSNFNYGISFGSFESTSSVLNFLSSIELVRVERVLEPSQDELKLVYKYG